ncbi:MbcA/ParS/Xre antitoxin family protein [Reichenbachiella carrageenanivorans]|uniref:MbcA/ParS/Xre antitoxin family protein n=1 Tax=Reichenbachiella carrageenanivorans TaxID=2979869 RepID=A0ABY6CZK8_9BACT|nr:MbcA/ParS/Xre antitoxin family protein [Reichenbachiella carrageenanivorans]UXX79346.1 MbcA/ParS/Xre antitoxin family protein [Reichenbachiella carrageenanivorans]
MGENKKTYDTPKDLPLIVSEPEILYAVRQQNINSTHITLLKDLSGLKDDLLSATLNMNTKTFRSYKLAPAPIKPHVQEHVLALLSLFKHGIAIFGTSAKFNQWLSKVNFYFDNDAPINFLNTISGILHVDYRLSAIEYGDNV